jgi:hypothetical protein
MLYSPAHVGATGGIRIAADDRRFRIKNFYQNGTTKSPAYLDWRYCLTSVAADMPLLKAIVPKRDVLGIGAVAQYGRNDPGVVQKHTIRNWGLSTAYHKAIGKQGRHYLSAGLRYMRLEYDMESEIFPEVYEEANTWAASVAWLGSPADKVSYFVSVTRQTSHDKAYWSAGREPLLGDFRKLHRTSLMAGMCVNISNAASVCVNGYYCQPNSNTIEIMNVTAYARWQVQCKGKEPLFVYGGGQYMKMKQATGIGPSAGVSWRNVRLNTAYEIVTAYNPHVLFRSGALETSLVYTARNKTKPYTRLPQTFL